MREEGEIHERRRGDYQKEIIIHIVWEDIIDTGKKGKPLKGDNWENRGKLLEGDACEKKERQLEGDNCETKGRAIRRRQLWEVGESY